MIHVLFKFAKNPYGGVEIDTTSGSGNYRGLSPFVLGPITLPAIYSENFENLWQFSKVYWPEHVDADSNPTQAWYDWRASGFANKRAQRYPMGKGRKPLYSMWGETKLEYVQARKEIYAPIYAHFVRETPAYKRLEAIHASSNTLVLRDYDAYDHIKEGVSLAQVINNPNKKCGHAFVLAMMLEDVLEECVA